MRLLHIMVSVTNHSQHDPKQIDNADFGLTAVEKQLLM